jgi:3-oxoadipate enol-lactonase
VVARTVLTANPIQLLAATSASLRAEPTGLAARLEMSTLLVWGRDDRIVPAEVGVQLAAAIPDATLVVIEGAGHQPQWDRPDAFHAAVLPFIAGTEC